MYYDYSAWQWLLVFYLYCFLGWCFESTVVSVQQRHFVNRGFLHGPTAKGRKHLITSKIEHLSLIHI